MHRIDGAGHVNYTWVAEDLATNRPPTEITPEIMNALQEEVANVIEPVMPLDKADNTQLWQAISTMIAAAMVVVSDATTVVKGIVKLATDALTQDGADATTAVTPASLSSRTSTETRTGLAKVATQAVTDAGVNDTDFITSLKLKNTTLLGLGYGQTWQDVKANRASGVTYTNTTGKPIEVSVSCTSVNGYIDMYATVSGVRLNRFQSVTPSSTAGGHSYSFVVPNGATYSVTFVTCGIDYWTELR